TLALRFGFFRVDFDATFFEIQPDSSKNSHIDIRDPNQRKTCDHVAAPVGEQELVSGNDENSHGHVMAQTVFTRKNIEKLPFGHLTADLAFRDTILPEFTYYLFVRQRPG